MVTRRHLCFHIAALMALALTSSSGFNAPCCATPLADAAAVVTVNAEAKTSDVGSAKVSIFRLLNHSGTIHVIPMNELSKPQSISVRFNEMTLPSYDVYMDGSRVGTFTPAQLAAGLKVDLPPVILPADRPIMQRLLSNSDEFIKSIKGVTPGDVRLVTSIMANVRSWSRTADARLRNTGAVYILVNPSDRVTENVTWIPQPADAAITATQKYWRAITFERRALYTRVKDPALKDRAISAITPLDFKVKLNKGTANSVSCVLVNQSEVPLSGKLILEGAPGPKPTPVSFESLGPDKSFTATFKLAALPADLKPESLKVRADITVGTVTFVKTVTVAGDGQAPGDGL